jgi:hypothetical protein
MGGRISANIVTATWVVEPPIREPEHKVHNWRAVVMPMPLVRITIDGLKAGMIGHVKVSLVQ